MKNNLKRKSQLEAIYNAGRSYLLIMFILTVVNLVPLEANLTFYFTAFFPYLAAGVAAASGAAGTTKVIIIIIGCVLPLAFMLLCWYMTGKKRYGWMKTAAGLMVADTVIMLFMFVVTGFSSDYISLYVVAAMFHIFLLWSLFKSVSAAEKLKKGEYTDDTQQPVVVGSVGDMVASDGDKTTLPAARRFIYNKSYAKNNRADKYKYTYYALAAYIVLMFISIFIIAASENVMLGTVMFLSVAVIGLVAVLALNIKLTSYARAMYVYYTLGEDGLLTQVGSNALSYECGELRDMKLLEKADDHWLVEYTDAKGKTKKLLIPNAYPGLDEYLNSLWQK